MPYRLKDLLLIVTMEGRVATQEDVQHDTTGPDVCLLQGKAIQE
jgi:hypothetical protein